MNLLAVPTSHDQSAVAVELQLKESGQVMVDPENVLFNVHLHMKQRVRACQSCMHGRYIMSLTASCSGH